MEKEMFAEFGDVNSIEDVRDESAEQEGPFARGVGGGKG